MITRFDPATFEQPGDALPRPHADCYWLVPGRVLAGRYPVSDEPASHRREIDALLDAGVTHCIDLTHESEALAPYAEPLSRGAAARGRVASSQRYSVADFGVPSTEGMQRTLAAVDAALVSGGTVYIHCRAGIGRTGTLVACLLRAQGLSADDAAAVIQFKRQAITRHPGAASAPETPEQRDFVERWPAR